MPRIPVPFAGPSYQTQSPTIDCERSMNFYVEAMESPNAKTQYALYPTPGFTLFATMPLGPCRGCFSQDGRVFFVGGTTLYELSSSGTLTAMGTMAVDEFPATLCSNGLGGKQLFVTSGNTGYILNLTTNVLTSVLAGCRFGGFIDGYFLALDAGTSTLKISALENGASWDPADVAQRSTAGDKWIAMGIASREAWLLGSQSGEVWYDSGASLFPFQPISGALFEYGIVAPFSMSVLDVPNWLGSNDQGDAVWYRAEGYTPRRVSTHSVEHFLQTYDVISDAVAFSYQDRGHQFSVMNLASANATWCFDQTSKMFHERGYWNPDLAIEQAYRPQYHTFAFNQHLVGDRSSGGIYTMDVATSTEVNGAGIRRYRQVPVYTQSPDRVYHSRLDLDVETGLGLVSGQGSAPQVVLLWSNDGGKTFGNEHVAGAGALGAYGTRVYWTRLGQTWGNRRVYRAVMTDAIPWRIGPGWLTVEAGA